MSNLSDYGLDAHHTELLEWFDHRAGQTVRYPKTLPDGSFLVSAPKGIYKPKDQPYALSVRVNLRSKYNDGHVFTRSNGTWVFAYHQENPNPSARDEEFTNVALMECVRKRVPVGVLIEIPVKGSAPSEYDVLGLAIPVGWRDGYFFFEGFGPSGPDLTADTYGDVLFRSAEQEVEDEEATTPPPDDDYDARIRVNRQIVARRGQRTFRRALVKAYEGRCVVSGSAVDAVLEAAHIRPYRGPDSNTTTNGFLLRADLHTLLDLQLLAIEPLTREVRVSFLLGDSEYKKFDGTRIAEPVNQNWRPGVAALESAWAEFESAESARNAADQGAGAVD